VRADELLWMNSEYGVADIGKQIPVRGPGREG